MGWQRLAVAVLGLAFVWGAHGAAAALKKYQIRTAAVENRGGLSPVRIEQLPGPPGIAVIEEDATPGRPVLRRFAEVEDVTVTIIIPTFGGFAFLSTHRTEGPTGEFTGTGGTDTTIAWGLLTGWTVTGATWCNAFLIYICPSADLVHRGSVDPSIFSSFYELGTWTFHATGFTGTPFVFRTYRSSSGNSAGNLQHVYRGLRGLDGAVPTLPSVGLACLAASLVLGSLAALRRGRR